MFQHASFTGSIPAVIMIFSDAYASCFSFPRKRERGREGEGWRSKFKERQTDRNKISLMQLFFPPFFWIILSFFFWIVLSSFFCFQCLFNCFYPMFINFRPVKPSRRFALTVIYGPPAECNPPGARECNTQLHSAYTRVQINQ